MHKPENIDESLMLGWVKNFRSSQLYMSAILINQLPLVAIEGKTPIEM